MRPMYLAAPVLALCLLCSCASRPIAGADAAVAMRDIPQDIPVLANDKDPRGRPLIVVRASGARQGTTTVNTDNSVRYTPRRGAHGDDSFEYLVKNSSGRGAWGRVNVTVIEPLPVGVLASPEPLKVPPARRTEEVPAPSRTRAAGDAASAPSRTPAASDAPPAAAPAVPVTTALLQGVSVTLFTREDDKDAGEPVVLTIKRGQETLAEKTVGETEAWSPNTERTEELTLARAVPLAEAARLTLEVRKTPSGPGAGGSWTVQVDAQGRLSDQRTVSLVSKTLPFRFGDGSSTFRTWSFEARP